LVALIGASLASATAANAQEAGVDQPASIAFVNPTAGTSLVVNDKAAADATYRILAWVDNAASGSVVEFELEAEGERPITIGLATRGSDTFQYLWSIPASIDDGTYALRALLFAPTANGVEQVAQDEETITITRAAATMDILYPTVGGRFGTFTSGASTAGVIDAANSSDVGSVSAFYTTTAPGSEPEWKLCGTETRAEAEDGIRCNLQGDAGAIRAVATVPNGSGAADATKVSLPYEQRAESFVVAPAVYDVASYSDGTFPCSAPVTAELLDQFARPIAGANVDVHAFGPSDQLSFDTGTASAPGPVAAPDRGHGLSESGYVCSGSSGEPALPQAEHNAPAVADTKHVESTVGTSDGGQFQVRLHSDSTGSTELTMWADENDDDQMLGEKNASARIQWNLGDEPPPKPTPSEREITLVPARDRVDEHARVRMSGGVVSPDSSCMALQSVVLKRRFGGERKFKTIKRLTTDEAGLYATRVRMGRTSEYRAIAPATDICLRAVSSIVKVKIRR